MRSKDLPFARMEQFFDYGDAETYHSELGTIRAKLLD